MTTYTETFAGQTTGIDSTTFTNRYDSETSVTVETPALGVPEEDERVLQMASGDSGHIAQTFDDVDGDANRDEVEVVARFWQAASGTEQFQLLMRGTGGIGTEDYYGVGITAVNRFAMFEWKAGVGPSARGGTVDVDLVGEWFNWLGDFGTTVPPGRWIWFRMRVNGTGATVSLSAKFWLDGTPEPADWALETTDTDGDRITGVGWAGVSREGHTQNVYLDYFSVGTNGDSPVIAADAAVPIRITGNYAQVVHAADDPVVRITANQVQVLLQATNPEVRVTGSYIQVAYNLDAGGGGQEGSLIIAT